MSSGVLLLFWSVKRAMEDFFAACAEVERQQEGILRSVGKLKVERRYRVYM